MKKKKRKPKLDYNPPGYSSTKRLANSPVALPNLCKHYSGNIEVMETREVDGEIHTSLKCGRCGKSWVAIETAADDAQWTIIKKGVKKDEYN